MCLKKALGLPLEKWLCSAVTVRPCGYRFLFRYLVGFSQSQMMNDLSPDAPPVPTFREALRFWSKLGWISFGGPAGQIAIMHKEIVERRRWLSEDHFLHALNFCMLLPGPEAQQLATYLGWRMHGARGGIAAGVLFVLPSVFILLALSWLYMACGEITWIQGLFYGLIPAVIAIVLSAVKRIGSKALKSPSLWVLAGT